MVTTDGSSLQESFAFLYQSAYLGVLVATEETILDANDAFLRMIAYSRDELRTGRIDWWSMTPERYRTLDANGLEQLREFGACVPFEKEYILRDGSHVPFMIGAVRLALEPLTWAAYTVDLSEHRKAATAEQETRDLKAKNQLVNQLAHDLNNPLAALTFLVHLLSTRPDIVTEDTRNLLSQAAEQLNRISSTLRQVLTVSQDITGTPPVQ